MAQIFISHAHEDRAQARALAAWLQLEGWTVWWDTEMLAGAAFRTTIEKQLEAAKSVVVLWSKDSVKSHWVADEAQAGAERNVLLPIILDGASIPLGFRQFHAVLMPQAFARGDPVVDALRRSIVAVVGHPMREQVGERGTPGPVVASPDENRDVAEQLPDPITSDPIVPSPGEKLVGDLSEFPIAVRSKARLRFVGLLVLVVSFAFGYFSYWIASRFTDESIIQNSAFGIGVVLTILLQKAIFPWLNRDFPNDA